MGDNRIMMRSPQGIRIHFFPVGAAAAIWHALQRILWRRQSVLHITPMLRDRCQGQLTDRYGSAAFVRELKYMVLSGSLPAGFAVLPHENIQKQLIKNYHVSSDIFAFSIFSTDLLIRSSDISPLCTAANTP